MPVQALVVTHIEREATSKMCISVLDLKEVAPREEGDYWMQYFNGITLRSCIIKESPQEIADMCNA